MRRQSVILKNKPKRSPLAFFFKKTSKNNLPLLLAWLACFCPYEKLENLTFVLFINHKPFHLIVVAAVLSATCKLNLSQLPFFVFCTGETHTLVSCTKVIATRKSAAHIEVRLLKMNFCVTGNKYCATKALCMTETISLYLHCPLLLWVSLWFVYY